MADPTRIFAPPEQTGSVMLAGLSLLVVTTVFAALLLLFSSAGSAPASQFPMPNEFYPF